MSTSNSVAAIPIVDTSYSMTQYNYVAITVIDTKAFLSQALQGDYIGVASYDTDGRVTYGLTLVDAALTVPAAASAAVQSLSFQGDRTNIGGGIQTAMGMLSSAPSWVPRAFVLLSDGEHNFGIPPLPLPAGSPPIYACAMGPNSNQELMSEIARASGRADTYHYAPYVYDMMKIYNEIRALAPSSQLLANEYKNAAPYDYLMIPVTVSNGNDVVQFSVVWSDTTIPFVNGPPGLDQISVTLVNPSGTILTPTPSIQGPAYVIFNVANPQAGLWHIQVMYGGARPQGLTGGGMEHSPSGNAAAIVLSAEAPTTVKAGTPLRFSIGLADDGKAMVGQQILTAVTKPKLSIRNALNTYAPLLKDIILSEGAEDRILDRKTAKLEALYRARLPYEDLLPHIKSGLSLLAGKDSRYEGVIEDTLQAGTYNVELQVTGFSEKSKTPFSRSKLFSVLVTD